MLEIGSGPPHREGVVGTDIGRRRDVGVGVVTVLKTSGASVDSILRSGGYAAGRVLGWSKTWIIKIDLCGIRSI